MSEKAGFLGLGTAGGIAAGAAVIAVVVGVLYATGILAPEEEAPVAAAPEAVETPAPAPEAAEDQTAAAEPAEPEQEPAREPEVTAAEAPADPAPEPAPLAAPTFDVVRASPDGTTLVAGKGVPGSTVSILVDGDVQDTQTIDASGEFVSFLSLPSSTSARVLSLSAMLEDQQSQSEDEIILAPTPAPQVAAAAPEPAAPAPSDDDETTANEAPAAASEETAAAAEPAPSAEADQVETASDDPAPATGDAPEAETVAEDTAVDTATATATQADPEPAATEPETAPAVAAAPAAPTVSEPQSAPDQPASITVLRADREGVELVQPAAPDAGLPSEQVALDTIGYSPEGDVLLSGRAVPEAGIRVYLNNVAQADLQAGPDGRWRGRLQGIAPGVYTLRLDALRPDGSVLSRVETPFKRERPEVLTASTSDAVSDDQSPPIRQVTVQRGDTLWAISRERYGDGFLYVRVFEANRGSIRDPDLIYPGQIFTIPE